MVGASMAWVWPTLPSPWWSDETFHRSARGVSGGPLVAARLLERMSGQPGVAVGILLAILDPVENPVDIQPVKRPAGDRVGVEP